ncbi:Jerky protein homolog-like [Seminavis robusta]|uniref:Jerky protein homolog-like n=1 Tax=Seminavis robusta TaxID=568900 RepID=A0A9N8DFR0_9STRA|nr:Jerky protein homolog-like [Seminavis robusta]|eukprot:Sro128_g061350.1 Jerky protein homolog-like (858) ;mRNA; f:88915-91787
MAEELANSVANSVVAALLEKPVVAAATVAEDPAQPIAKLPIEGGFGNLVDPGNPQPLTFHQPTAPVANDADNTHDDNKSRDAPGVTLDGGDEGKPTAKDDGLNLDALPKEGDDNGGTAETKEGEVGVVDGKGDGKDDKKKGAKTITRIRYSNDFKVKLLDELEVLNVTVAEMARRHKLPEATIRDWVKTKDKIITAQVNRRGSAKSNSRDNLQKVTDTLRTFMDMNDRLEASGSSKLPITNAMIAKQGQEIKALLLEKDAKKPFLTAQERKTLNAFNASIWWSKKWARKHNLHSVGHREAAKAAAALSSQVPEIRRSYSKDHVFFVVDTMLFYKVLPTRSVVENPVEAGNSAPKYLDTLKGRLSLFICSNSSGGHKIPLTMISDEKNPPSFVGKRQRLFPHIYQENAWANPKALLTWWKETFLPNIREWTDEKVLLILQKPSIVDLDDPQDQVRVRFLPPLLANNHNSTSDGLSISSFFETPIKLLSVVKTKYRYYLLKEVFQVFEERHQRREVADAANFRYPGLKQGHLPHLQDCMRILNDVWNELPPEAIGSVDDEDGKKKKKRRRRKKKGTSEEDIIENDSMGFTDGVGTDELIKDIVLFFRKNDGDVRSLPTNDELLSALDKSVAEVKRCFVNDKLLLQSNQEELRRILRNWIGLEESQEVRQMLQTEILSGMKFRLIVGVDDVDNEEEEPRENDKADGKTDDTAANNDKVALDVATQLLQCAVRLSKENSAFHNLASQLVEASDAAFVALRLSKLPPELREKKEPLPKKKRKPRTTYGPRKKRVKLAETDGEKVDKEDEEEITKDAVNDVDMKPAGEPDKEAEDTGRIDLPAKDDPPKDPVDDYDGTVFIEI